MIRLLLVLALIAGTSNVALAELKDADYCKGMSIALNLPDEQVFNTLIVVSEQTALKEYGLTSERYLNHIQTAAYQQGYGAGLGHGVKTAMGFDYAFKMFMRNCYEENHTTREQWLKLNEGKQLSK